VGSRSGGGIERDAQPLNRARRANAKLSLFEGRLSVWPMAALAESAGFIE